MVREPGRETPAARAKRRSAPIHRLDDIAPTRKLATAEVSTISQRHRVRAKVTRGV